MKELLSSCFLLYLNAIPMKIKISVGNSISGSANVSFVCWPTRYVNVFGLRAQISMIRNEIGIMY